MLLYLEKDLEDVIKDLERRSSWVMGLKSSDKRPYKRHTEEKTVRRGGGDVTTEAEMQQCSHESS